MDRDNPLDRVDLAEEELRGLLRALPPLAPSDGFVGDTLRAIRREPLPAGRVPLHGSLASLAAWAAIIAGVAVFASLIAFTQPQVASTGATLVTRSISFGMWLLQFGAVGVPIAQAMTTAGVAVSRAIVTAEGIAGMTLFVAVGVVSMSLLRRLLVSQGEGTPWQELS